MLYERWVQHNLIRDEGRLPALRELTQSAPVEKTAALSTQLRGAPAGPEDDDPGCPGYLASRQGAP
jgi:hypothetical protein